MNSRPQRVDQLARAIWNRAAMAAGMNDTEVALEVCRELGEIEEAYELRLRCADPRLASTKGTKFTGRPMEAKFAGRCVVCSGAIDVGDTILYSREQKRAGHLRCGEVHP